MTYPITRPRRLRHSAAIRDLVRETHVTVQDLIYPLFVTPGENVKRTIHAMPGVYNLSVDEILRECESARDDGIRAVLLFGVPETKDAHATSAWDENGIVQVATRAIKSRLPDLLVVTDVCLCEYTDHGHCGMVENGRILNDESLPIIAKTALSHARAGADIVAPSDMMDGRVAAIRSALDGESYAHVPIMSYSAKYASAFYGPFREAAGSAPAFGDRKTYQMDCANRREAVREAALDIAEGADIVMVKPALAYLDIIRDIRETVNVPVAAYNVSGEYSMVKAAARHGWIDERRVVMESLISMKRAGADMICTYHARDAARWL